MSANNKAASDAARAAILGAINALGAASASEIAIHLGFKPQSVRDYLMRMRKSGLVVREQILLPEHILVHKYAAAPCGVEQAQEPLRDNCDAPSRPVLKTWVAKVPPHTELLARLFGREVKA